MIPCVIYARYSSSSQREESIAGQLRECRKYADRNGMNVIREYTDSALTATSDRRPAFQRMIADSDRQTFQAVLVWKLDRFARDRYDAAFYRKQLKNNGVKLISVMENIAETPEGIIMEGLLEAMAEYYSANLSENIKRGNYDSAMERKKLTSQILGYRKGEDGRYEIDPVTASIVKRIFEEYTSGKPRSMIIAGLNKDGLRTAKGAEFKRNSLYTILKNEKYIGMYRYKDIEDPNGIPPIIDKEVFYKAQKMIKDNSFKKNRADISEPYELVSKLFCGECGCPMTGESARSATGKIFKYYSCTGRKKHTCTKSRIRKDAIEQAMIQIVNGQILTDEMIETFIKAYEDRKDELTDNRIADAYRAELAETETKIRNINKAIEDGIYAASTAARLAELEEHQLELIDRIKAEEARNPAITSDMLREYFRDLREKAKTDDECQRTILDIFLRRVWVFEPQKKRQPLQSCLRNVDDRIRR